MMHNWTRPGGCRERALACQKALEEYHGPGIAFVHSLQNISPSSSTFASESNLTALCTDILACVPALPYYTSSPAALPLEDHRGWFDITHPRADPFPEPHHFGFLSEEATLRALGVPVNFTSVSAAVHRRFDASFDFVAGGFREALAWLLDGGDGCVPGIDDQDGYCDVDVAVHLIYGDRDYACAWPGGEEVALSIPWMHQEEFVSDVGYAPLLVGERKEWKGMTRQLGPLSFTRVFQAGHEVPSYQPQAAYEIFTRAMSGRDVATGKIAVRDKKGSYGGRRKHGNGMYRTTGPTSSWHVKNEPPPMPRPRCYVLKPITCVPAVWERVKKGQALVRDWFVIDDDGEDERLGLSDEL